MDDFSSHLRKTDSKSIKKALGFSLKIDAVLPLCKNVKFQQRYCVSAHAETSFKIPYKTCRLFILLGPFAEKDPQKYQKSITFSLKVDVVLRLCETSKTVGKTTFWESYNLDQYMPLISLKYRFPTDLNENKGVMFFDKQTKEQQTKSQTFQNKEIHDNQFWWSHRECLQYRQ